MNESARVEKLTLLIQDDIKRLDKLGQDLAVCQSKVDEHLSILHKIIEWASEAGVPTKPVCLVCDDPKCPGDFSHYELPEDHDCHLSPRDGCVCQNV